MVGSPRRILRFFGDRGDFLAAEAPEIVIYDGAQRERIRIEVNDFIDVAPVRNELWVLGADRLTRVSSVDGKSIGSDPITNLTPSGRLLLSATAPHLPVWHSARPGWVRSTPASIEVPGPGGELIFPINDGRWMLWQAGQLRLWRTIGEAWRRSIGEPGSRPVDAQVLLDGRLFALAQRRQAADAELRLTVVSISDGAQTTQLRLSGVGDLLFAARRGIVLARAGDRLSVIDLRFGRWVRDLILPEGTTDIAVDNTFQHIALGTTQGLEIVVPDALAASTFASSSPVADDDPRSEDAPPEETEQVAETHEPAPPAPPPDEPLPTEPLVRLDPLAVQATATDEEISHSIETLLQLVAARVHVAIAEAWDSGQLSRPEPTRPPFAEEVSGLLGISHGRASAELAIAVDRLRKAEAAVVIAERHRAGRLTPVEVLAKNFGLSDVAVVTLFAIVAPNLRGELARLYGILGNDPGRPIVDEHLIGQLLGKKFVPVIARELDGDRALRRYGIVRLGAGQRPFAALTVDSLVTRYLANQPLEGEPDHHLKVRHADRTLDELQLPRALIAKALRYLASPREKEPARVVIRGRTGAGRHTLLAALAARAGRGLAVIDAAAMPRGAGVLGSTLEASLRRALLRGLLPCVDGLESLGGEDPETTFHVSSALRQHPGPLAVRLPTDARPALDPGYLLLDVPTLGEHDRGESWSIALRRHSIALSNPSELAARYRIGPGTIERVCAELAKRPERPADDAAWVREFDDTVRQHLENRLGQSATRVTKLASWADIVLPEDILDSLLELTARVRHRKKVYEQWGFDKSITTARGITALFTGGPGTGKTMVAGVIARDLGMDLYRVDVSRITSKWIGETEKNLGSMFDAAEDGQVMLLFDEADSLFAKRTEVKTSVDRYSNMEVNYLLQRLDTFEGIAILTSNFGNAIDPAFRRRLTYRVTFPFPDEEMREQLWRSLLPAQVPTSGPLDFAALSRKFRLSGGYIRNATLRAAFLAAEEGTALTQAHLERAIRMEFREIGKLAESGTLE